MKKQLNKKILVVGIFVVMALLTITPPSHAQVVAPDEAKVIAMSSTKTEMSSGS
jgi:hypothetical protein